MNDLQLDTHLRGYGNLLIMVSASIITTLEEMYYVKLKLSYTYTEIIILDTTFLKDLTYRRTEINEFLNL